MQEGFLHATNRSERPVAAISIVSPLGSPGRTEGITTEPKYRSAPMRKRASYCVIAGHGSDCSFPHSNDIRYDIDAIRMALQQVYVVFVGYI